MSAQFFRSVASKGVRTREFQNAESKRDFIDKFKMQRTMLMWWSTG